MAPVNCPNCGVRTRYLATPGKWTCAVCGWSGSSSAGGAICSKHPQGWSHDYDLSGTCVWCGAGGAGTGRVTTGTVNAAKINASTINPTASSSPPLVCSKCGAPRKMLGGVAWFCSRCVFAQILNVPAAPKPKSVVDADSWETIAKDTVAIERLIKALIARSDEEILSFTDKEIQASMHRKLRIELVQEEGEPDTVILTLED